MLASDHCLASEQVSGASEQANGRASVPVLMSGLLAVLDHSSGRRIFIRLLTREKANCVAQGLFITTYKVLHKRLRNCIGCCVRC